jgi:acyl-CoA synthetase (NDP forming)
MSQESPPRNLSPLFTPTSVAVVGASADPAKWGYWLARGALAGRNRRAVFLVNHSGAPVLDQPTAPTLSNLTAVPELAVVAVPAAAFEPVVDEALALGVQAIVGVTAGVSDEAAERVRAKVRAAGAVLLGPNCMGVADTGAQLTMLWGELPPGRIGLLSQSGNLAIELAGLAKRDGLGFSRFASLGNQWDLTAADLLATAAADGGTDVVALYLEDFQETRRLAQVAYDVQSAGTPVVLLAAGRGDVARRAAASHTGALAGDRAALEAACRAAGIVMVDTPSQLVEVAHALSARSRPLGSAVAVVADGGGHGVVASDLLEGAGFTLPVLSGPTQQQVLAPLPPMAVATNPVDLAGGGEQDHMNYAHTMAAVLASGEVDAALFSGYFGAYGVDEPRLAAREAEVAQAIVDAVAASGRPAVMHSVAPDGGTAAVLRAGGVPVVRRVEGAVAGLAGLRTLAHAPGVPPIPPPGPPTPDGDAYLVGRDLLAAAGLRFPELRVVDSAAAAAAAVDELGGPVVLKALGLAHKSDVGGVVLAVTDADGASRHFDDFVSRLGRRSVVVEQMVSERGVELIVGARNDPAAGPLVVVGLGGVQAEVWADVAVALGPVDADAAGELLRRLRGYPLLCGFRGAPPVDLIAVASAVAAVSRVVAERPDLAAAEVNPLLATPSGAWALDANLDRG